MSVEIDQPGRPRRRLRTRPAKEQDAVDPTGQPSTRPAPPKLQRRPVLVALAVVLVAVGALLTAYLVTTSGNTTAVVAVRTDVERGSVIERGALVEARINGDPALTTIPGDQIDSLIGKRAAVDLHAGGLVSPASVTDSVLPAKGQTIVGVALTPAQRPSYPLRAGDPVRIILTPRPQDDLPRAAPTTVKATVVAVREVADANQVVVDVSVPAASAPAVASIVGTARVALVLDNKP